MSDKMKEALEAICQRANESRPGEMGAIDTIHAMHAIATAALAQATPDQPVTTEMPAKLANLASGCRVKADLYAKVDPTIPASFTWVANEIDHILASASHRNRSAP